MNSTSQACRLTYCRLRRYRYLVCLHGQLRNIHGKIATAEKLQAKGYSPVIGLEIHAQIQAESKIFSRASTRYGASVNSQVALLDLALPGTLPVLNRRCVEAGVMTSLALNANLNHSSYFDRKHYFYADMPAGYQVTQQRRPLATGGHMTYSVAGESRTVNIHQLQLEQDSGKSLHDTENNHSLIDLNRAGVGLMEIVTEPDFRSSQEARAFVKELQLMLTALDTCSCRMQEGALRVDASISLHRPGEPLGTRCEVKNLNSLAFMEKAIEYEINRQLGVLEEGSEVENETRMFDAERGVTVSMRDKEKVHDYRFMPEPNLLPLRLYRDSSLPTGIDSDQVINIDEISRRMPLLPAAMRRKLLDYGLKMVHANQILSTEGFYELFCGLHDTGALKLPVIIDVLLFSLPRALKELELADRAPPITAAQMSSIVALQQDGKITSQSAFLLVRECLVTSQLDVYGYMCDQNLEISYNMQQMGDLVQRILTHNNDTVKKLFKTDSDKKKIRYRKKLKGILISEANNKYDPKLLLKILDEHLQKSRNS